MAQLPHADDGLPTPRRYAAILAMSLGTGLVVIDGTIVNVALPTIARDLAVAPSAAVLIVTVYQLVLVMLLLPFSALGARIGLRRLYQYGLLLFTVATALCFFTRSLPFLLVVRALQALGAGAVLSVSSALIRSIYPSTQLGRGLALNSVVVSIATASAPSLGGLILAVAPWPWLFAVAAPLGLLSMWLGWRSLPEPSLIKEPYDVLAAVLCALTFGLIISGLESTVQGDSPVVSLTILAAGIAIAVIFVRRELQSAAPILPVDLLSRPAMALSGGGAVLAFIGSMEFLLSLPFRLQQEYGLTPAEVGAVITPWPLTMLLVGPLAGLLSDRVPAGILGATGMAAATVAMLLLAYLPADPTQLDIAWRMALCGGGFGLFFVPNARYIALSAPLARAASVGGLISTIRLTGQTLGATLLASLLALQLGDGRVPALTAAGLTLIAGLFSVARVNMVLPGSTGK
jgi:DHA2 family multidrug resistance protein-like MFS transporter